MGYTQQFGVNELGEIVTAQGKGSTNIVASLPADFIPTDELGRMLIVSDTSELTPSELTSSAIQAVADSITLTGKRATIKLEAGAVYTVTTPITINTDLVSINGNGAVLTVSGAITALTLTSQDVSPDDNCICTIEKFKILGDLTTGQRGIYLHKAGASGYGPSRISIKNVSIKTCDIGEEYGSNSYLQGHYSFSIHECNTGIKCPSGLTNSYELPSYYNCIIANNIIGIDIGEGQLTFFGSSLDYNRRQAVMTGGRILLMGCHVESNLKRSTYSAGQVSWSLTGTSSVIMQGGRLIYTAGTGTDLDYIFDCATTQDYDAAGVYLYNVTLQNANPASGYLAKGVGNCYLDNCISRSDTTLGKGVHNTYNMLDFGTFEGAIFPTDMVAVTNGGTISNRVSSTNVSISQSPTAAKSGTNGLLITKNTAAGSSGTADVCILSPVRNSHGMHSGRLYYRHNGTSARQITIQFGYFKTLFDVFGSQTVPQIKDTSLMVNSAINLPGSDTGWVDLPVPNPYRRPPKNFEYVGWRIRVHDMNSTETLFIDDVEIHQW